VAVKHHESAVRLKMTHVRFRKTLILYRFGQPKPHAPPVGAFTG